MRAASTTSATCRRAAALPRPRTGVRVLLLAALLPAGAWAFARSDPDVARDRVLQRWPEWARAGLVDLLCPMAYRRDTGEVERLLNKARAAAPKTRMWGGLMAYAGERELMREQVRAAHEAGCDGAILFAYDPAQRDLLDVFAAT